MRFKQMLLALPFLLTPLSTLADLHECNGVWTNTPCQGEAQHTLAETTTTPDPLRKELSERDLWLHDLEMRRLRAKREYNIDIDISEARALCQNIKTTAIQCKQTVTEKNVAIDGALSDAERLEQQKKDAEKKATSNDPATVVVIQNNDGYPTPFRTPYPPPVFPQPHKRKPPRMPAQH